MPKEPSTQGPNDKDDKKRRSQKRNFAGGQTPEEREEEKSHTGPFTRVAVYGSDWWRQYGWQPSADDRLMVQMLKFSGYTDEDVASALYMSVETLQKHFDFELKNAKTLIIGDLATRAYVRARQGNDVMTMFLLKTRGGGAYSEKAAMAASITDSLKDAESLSDEKKAQVISSLVDLLSPKREKTAKEETK